MSDAPAPPVSASTGSHALLGTAAQLARGPRTRKALAHLVAGVAIYETAKPVYDKVRTRLRGRSYTVTVTSADAMWADIHRWLLDRLPDEDRHALVAGSGRSSSDATATVMLSSYPGGPTYQAEPETVAPRRPVLDVRYDGAREQTIDIGGHDVVVKLEKPDGGKNASDEEFGRWLRHEDRIVFTAPDRPARDAVLGFLRGIVEASWTPDSPARPAFYMGRWGSWDHVRDVPPRPIDTVILKAGQMERIVADLERFLSLKDHYDRAGAPWHRGYLFHGPPGTGKTSLAKALAQRFDLDIYYLPLSDLTTDTNLHHFLGQVAPRSMLVLEDIDVVHAARERDEQRDDDTGQRRISASGLLNALDGLGTPNGLVTVMTTYDVAVLDPALIRPGRADLQEELGYLDDDQLARLGAILCPGYPIEVPIGGGRTHAEVASAAVPYLDQPDLARAAIESLLAPAGRWADESGRMTMCSHDCGENVHTMVPGECAAAR